MSNRFFIASKCDRCGRDLTVRVMFRFNTDTLCPKCEQEERLHPDYQKPPPMPSVIATSTSLVSVRRGKVVV